MSNRRKEVLAAAETAVSTFRNSSYGVPETSFKRIAEYWQVYLNNMVEPLKPHDVAALMILMKLARLQQDPRHFDSIVDIAGYAACWADVIPPLTIGEFNPAIWRNFVLNLEEDASNPQEDPYTIPQRKEHYDF